MVAYDITHMELFYPNLDFEACGENVDLYNYYHCSDVSILNYTLTFTFKLNLNRTSFLFNTVKIIFYEFKINNQTHPLEDLSKAQTILNLQRCKFEDKGKLFESDQKGRNCYLVEFMEGLSVELLAQKVIVECIIEKA